MSRGLRVTSGMLQGVSNRMAFLFQLDKYYLTEQWKHRRDEYLVKVGKLSEVSEHPAQVVHHINYTFKSIQDFKNLELYGKEKDSQLLALTNAEHNVVHNELQHVAHRTRLLLPTLKKYYNYI